MAHFLIPLSIALLLASCTSQFENPSDSRSKNFTVKSRAFIQKITPGDLLLNDTALFFGGITSPEVEEAGLVKRFAWDFNGDGVDDTLLAATDTLQVCFRTPGDNPVSITLMDGLSKTSVAETTIFVHDSLSRYISNDSVDGSCAFYAQNALTMKPVLLFCQFLTYRNKQESMALGAFVFDILKNITGTVNPATFSLPYNTGFGAGLYTFSNGSLAISAAFHYGPGMTGHAEDDTLKSNLFSLNSYITNLHATTSPPFYAFTQGPLFDLISNVSVDLSSPLNPKVTIDLDLFRLKFSCYRAVSDHYTLSGSAIDAAFFTYDGFARIHPFPLNSLIHLVNADSLRIDMSNSKLYSPHVPLILTAAIGGVNDSVTIDVQLTQTMLSQNIYFGNSGGNNKAWGNYAATSQLQANASTIVNSCFQGNYSSSQSDSASFYCDSGMTSKFGDLYFADPAPDSLTFVSQRYAYGFTMGQGIAIRQ